MKYEDLKIEEVNKALDTEIMIASVASAKTRKNKTLMYNPSTLRYRVRFMDTDTGDQISNSYLDPLTAIDKYNQYYV